MAFVEEETFEGFTAGDSPVGAVVDSLNVAAGCSVEVSAAAAIHGSLGVRHVSASGSANGIVDFPAAYSAVFLRWYWRVDALPASNHGISNVRLGATNQAQLQLLTDGTLRIRNHLTAVDVTTMTVVPGQVYRFEWSLEDGVGQTFRIWTGATLESSDPLDAVEELSGAYTRGTMDNFRVGPIATPGAVTLTHDTDSWAWDTTSWVGPTSTGPESFSGTGAASASSSLKAGGVAYGLDGIVFREAFEGTPGATITDANSVFELTKGTGAPTFESTPTPVQGATVGALDPLADSVRLKHEFASADVPITYVRAYVRASNLPATFERFLGLETSEVGVSPLGEDLGTVAVWPSGKLRLRGATGFDLANETASAWMSSTDWIRLEWKHDQIAEVSTLRVFAGANLHGATPDEEVSTTGITVSANGNPLVGLNVLAFNDWTLYVDALAVGVVDWIGPVDSGSGTASASATSSISSTGAKSASGTASASATSSISSTGLVPGLLFEEAFEGGSSGASISALSSIFEIIQADPATHESTPTPIEGSLVGRYLATGTPIRTKHEFEPAGIGKAFARLYLYFEAYPSAVMRFLTLETSPSASPAGEDVLAVRMAPSGLVRLYDGSTFDVANETLSAFPLNEWMRVEYAFDDSVGTFGTSYLRVFTGANLHGTTPDETLTVAHLAAPANPVTTYAIGVLNNVSVSYSADAIKVSSSDWIGPIDVASGTASVSATSSVSATGAKSSSGTASASSTSSISSTGEKRASGSSSLSSTSSISSTGAKLASGSSSLSSTSSISSTGEKRASGSSSLSVTSSLSASGVKTGTGTASASAASSVSSTGTPIGSGTGTASASATSSTSATGSKATSGSSSLSSTSSISSAGSKLGLGSASASSTSSISSTGFDSTPAPAGSGTGSASASSSVTTAGQKLASGTTSGLSAVSSSSSTGAKRALADAILSSTSSISSTGEKLGIGSASLAALSSISSTGGDSTGSGRTVERPGARFVSLSGAARFRTERASARLTTPSSGARFL